MAASAVFFNAGCIVQVFCPKP